MSSGKLSCFLQGKIHLPLSSASARADDNTCHRNFFVFFVLFCLYTSLDWAVPKSVCGRFLSHIRTSEHIVCIMHLVHVQSMPVEWMNGTWCVYNDALRLRGLAWVHVQITQNSPSSCFFLPGVRFFFFKHLSGTSYITSWFHLYSSPLAAQGRHFITFLNMWPTWRAAKQVIFKIL